MTGWKRGPSGPGWRRSLAIAAAVAAVAACEDGVTEAVDGAAAPAVGGQVDVPAGALVADVTEALELSAEQRARVDAVAARHDGAGTGSLWAVAADLAQVLTDEQVAAVAAGLEAARAGGPHGPGHALRGRRAGNHGRLERLADELGLDAEQRNAIDSIVTGHRERARELRAAIDGVLTAEQRAALESRRAAWKERRAERTEVRGERRAAMREARAAALELSAEQKAAFERLHEAWREAGRPHGPEARASRTTAVDEILTPEQREIVTLHHALVKAAFARRPVSKRTMAG